MENNERIEKLEKQVEFLTEELVKTNREVVKIVSEFKDVYNLINDVSKTSVERDMLLTKSSLTLSNRLNHLEEKLES